MEGVIFHTQICVHLPMLSNGVVLSLHLIEMVVVVIIEMVMISSLNSCNQRWTFSIVGNSDTGLSFSLRWKVRGLNARVEVEFKVF